MLPRRCFLQACAGVATAALIPSTLWAEIPGPELPLLDAAGKPLKAASLAVGENYLFHYPHVSTPCLLVNLGETAKPRTLGALEWPGGVGKERSVVAYLAICPHGQTHVQKEYAMVSYLPEPREIRCCSHGSRFAAAEGGSVLGGPSPMSLPTVQLAWSADTDLLTVRGLIGPHTLAEFFTAFEKPHAKAYPDGAKAMASEIRVQKLAQFSAMVIGC